MMRELDIVERRATRKELRTLEDAIYLWQDYSVPNSKAKKHHLVPHLFDADQLAIGTVIEMEHTDDPSVALEIAMVHLEEHPLYYAALEAAEEELNRR